MIENRYDAIIIGAGVIGSAVAYELARRGKRTLNIDKLPASGYGSTSNSCAIIRFSYSTYDGVAMSWEGQHYWDNWADYLADGVEGGGEVDERGLIEFIKCGTALVKKEGGHHEKVLPLLAELDIPHEDWSVEELIERFPAFDGSVFGPPKRPDDDRFWDDPTERLLGAVWTADSGYISDPQLSTHNLQRAAEKVGGQFLFSTEVSSIETEAGRVAGVGTSDGQRFEAPVVVNVAGPHSFVINRMAGLEGTMKINTRALRHEVHHVASPEGVAYGTTGCHLQDGDSGIYIRPEAGDNILIGSEDPACDPQEWIEDPDDYDREVSPAQWEAQVLRLARRMPDLGVPNVKRGVVDLYDVADDWIPIYDKTDLPGFYVAIGTSGNQYKNAGVAAHCMAELIDAVEAGHDHDTDPVTVVGRYTGLELNLGSFSRNREINENSSFSVNG